LEELKLSKDERGSAYRSAGHCDHQEGMVSDNDELKKTRGSGIVLTFTPKLASVQSAGDREARRIELEAAQFAEFVRGCMGMVVSSLAILNKFDDVIEQARRRPLAADSYEQLSEMIYERLVAFRDTYHDLEHLLQPLKDDGF
jgi:hypothetical protein